MLIFSVCSCPLVLQSQVNLQQVWSFKLPSQKSATLRAMGGGRNPERAQSIRSLSRIAKAHGVAGLPDNAARARVELFAEDLLKLELSPGEQEEVRTSKQSYLATFRLPDDNASEERGQARPSPHEGRVWKFMAVQLTYNCSSGDWAVQDVGVLQNLFDRFVAFIRTLASALGALGVSATMERASETQVHTHAYFHLSKPFHKRGHGALDAFKFEGICPHLSPNTASGKAYAGAVRYGHFYVVAEKVGSLLLGWRYFWGSGKLPLFLA